MEINMLITFGIAVLTAFLCLTVQGNLIFKDDSLNLSPLIKQNKTVEARELSAVDKTLFAGVTSHSGYINVDLEKDWNLFFWFFPMEGQTLHTTPLIIWLQGGPGCTSLNGIFTEIGPLHIVNGKVQKMPITWGSDYSLLFIDNPVGTGFSYSSTEEMATDEDMIGVSLFNFLQQFLDVFPELRKAPLFLAGESYAGKYIPAFGHYIHEHKEVKRPINFKGLAIGDGWIDPPSLLHYGEWSQQVGLTDQQTAQEITNMENKAREYLAQGNFIAYHQWAAMAFNVLKLAAPVSNYNYLKEADYNSNTDFLDFVNREEIKKALHAKNNAMAEDCDWHVYIAMNRDKYRSVKPWLEQLLDAQYGVMCYSGQLDLIVASALSEHTYQNLTWHGQEAYKKAQRYPIIDPRNNTIIGFLKKAENFVDVMIRGAGHMVPEDKPWAAKYIIDAFINEFKW